MQGDAELQQAQEQAEQQSGHHRELHDRRPPVGWADGQFPGPVTLSSAEVKMPPAYGTFKQAQRVKEEQGAQLAFDVE